MGLSVRAATADASPAVTSRVSSHVSHSQNDHRTRPGARNGRRLGSEIMMADTCSWRRGAVRMYSILIFLAPAPTGENRRDVSDHTDASRARWIFSCFVYEGPSVTPRRAAAGPSASRAGPGPAAAARLGSLRQAAARRSARRRTRHGIRHPGPISRVPTVAVL